MPEENPHTDKLREILREIAEKQEQKTRVHREHLSCLKDSFRKNRGNITDAELLEIILDASSLINKPEFDQEDDLDPYMDSLTFTTASLVEADGESLKAAWSEFLGKTFLDMKDRADDHYDIVAAWYFSKEMWSHSVAVYEHLYRQVRSVELVNDQESHAWWVLQLWKSCVKRGLKQRARELFGRISEYHDDGEISFADYDEVLRKEGELRYSEIYETINRDRHLAESRLQIEIGSVFDRLHDSTKRRIVDAELWSDDRMLNLEPLLGPLFWAQVIESEFHHKVYGPNKEVLGGLLVEKEREQTCGLGQIVNLIRSGSKQNSKTILEKKLPVWHQLLSVSGLVPMLERIRRDRNQIAHASSQGTYTKESSSKFVRDVRKSGWVFKFLSSLTVR